MKHLITLAFVLGAFTLQAQNTIWYHAIGNWRNGPVVHIGPLTQTTEAFTTPQLLVQLKEAHPEFKAMADIDILRFATPEEGEESRQVLKAKYGMRKLEVVMVEPKAVVPE